MKTAFKTPFVTSLFFHGAVLMAAASYFSGIKEAPVEFTPMEYVQIAEEKSAPVEVKKEEPKLTPKTEPKPEPVKKVEKIIEPPPAPVHEHVVEEKIEKLVEPPPPVVSEKRVEEPVKPVQEVITASAESVQANTESFSVPAPPASVPVQAPPPVEAVKVEPQGSKYGVEGGEGAPSRDEINDFNKMVHAKIVKAKLYPRWAKERGYEGKVRVSFTIAEDGKVKDLAVVKPCHCEILNKAACEAVSKAAPFVPKPEALKDKEVPMEMDIRFEIVKD